MAKEAIESKFLAEAIQGLMLKVPKKEWRRTKGCVHWWNCCCHITTRYRIFAPPKITKVEFDPSPSPTSQSYKSRIVVTMVMRPKEFGGPTLINFLDI